MSFLPTRTTLAATALALAVVSIVSIATALRPAPAQAIPLFADRTGASCELCHTVFPGMSNYGMMVMMSNLGMLPYNKATPTDFTALVFDQQYVSNPDGSPPPPKFHTDNLGFLAGGFAGPHFTYYLEQHVVDGGFIGGTDQAWVAYNELLGGTASLQFGKFHTPFPFMPAHRITMAPYATTAATQGQDPFNEDDSHWGVTLSQMQSTFMYSVSALGGNDLVGPGAFALAGDHTHSIDVNLMTMSDRALNYGVGVIRGETPVDDGIDSFSRSALYLQYYPERNRRLQLQAVGQVGSDSDASGTGAGARTRGGFVEAQFQLEHGNWSVLRWDTQNGDAPIAGATLEFIHQLAPNVRFSVEGRKLTTGTTLGAAFEWAGPWSRSHVLASPVLGSMPGMNMGGMSGMSMPAGTSGSTSMSGMNMQGMSMNAPAARGGSEAPLDDGPHGLFPRIESANPDNGARLFSAQCASCHGAGGAGGFGPRLIGLANSKTPSFFAWRIKDPVPPMPKLDLTDQEIVDLAAYVEMLGTAPSPPGPPQNGE